MDAVGHVAACGECFSCIFDHLLGVAEDDAAWLDFEIQNTAKHFDLRAVAHFVVSLLDRINGQRLALDRNLLGIAAEFADQAFDAAIHCCGEKQCLALLVHVAKDDFHVFAEAHVEHAVSFVEDANLDRIGAQRFAAKVVHDPTRRADDDVRAVAECTHLTVDWCAAVDGDRSEAAKARSETVDLFADLHGELTSWAEHEDLCLFTIDIDHIERGQAECGSFTRASLREADDVFAAERDGDRFCLNRRG